METIKKVFVPLLCISLFVLNIQPSIAEIPPIKVNLILLDKRIQAPHYALNESIKVEVIVQNESKNEIIVSKGLSSRVFYRDMRLIGPSGNLITPKNDAKTDGKITSHVPPLGFIEHNKKLVRAAPCEILSPEKEIYRQIIDLRDIFSINLPGYYSVQVQFSTVRFKSDICDVNDFMWQGILKSSTKYFFYQGNLKVKVSPEEWNISWKEKPSIKAVVAEIFYNQKIKKNSINNKTIRLNSKVEPMEVIEGELGKTFIFDPKLCVESLHNLIVGHSYPVIISGKLKNEANFGGSIKIQIVP